MLSVERTAIFAHNRNMNRTKIAFGLIAALPLLFFTLNSIDEPNQIHGNLLAQTFSSAPLSSANSTHFSSEPLSSEVSSAPLSSEASSISLSFQSSSAVISSQSSSIVTSTSFSSSSSISSSSFSFSISISSSSITTSSSVSQTSSVFSSGVGGTFGGVTGGTIGGSTGGGSTGGGGGCSGKDCNPSIITKGIKGCNFEEGIINAGLCLPNFLAHLIQFTFGFAAGICIVMIIFAGYEIVAGSLPGGSSEAGKTRLTWAIIGFIMASTSFFIMDFIISAIGG